MRASCRDPECMRTWQLQRLALVPAGAASCGQHHMRAHHRVVLNTERGGGPGRAAWKVVAIGSGRPIARPIASYRGLRGRRLWLKLRVAVRPGMSLVALVHFLPPRRRKCFRPAPGSSGKHARALRHTRTFVGVMPVPRYPHRFCTTKK